MFRIMHVKEVKRDDQILTPAVGSIANVAFITNTWKPRLAVWTEEVFLQVNTFSICMTITQALFTFINIIWKYINKHSQ